MDDDNEPSNTSMRASKNPNKGGNPKKQKKQTDKKAGHGSQPGYAKKDKKKFNRMEGNENLEAENSENYDANEDEGLTKVEEEDTGPKFSVEEYNREQKAEMSSNSLLQPKTPRAVDKEENLVTKEDLYQDNDEDVPCHGKKGKKDKKQKGGAPVLLEFTTSESGPTSDSNRPNNFSRGGSFNGNDRNNRNGGNRYNNDKPGREGRGGGRGRGNDRDRNGGNFSGGRGRGGGRDNRGRDGGRGGGRGREGGRGGGRGSRQLNINSEKAFPSLGGN